MWLSIALINFHWYGILHCVDIIQFLSHPLAWWILNCFGTENGCFLVAHSFPVISRVNSVLGILQAWLWNSKAFCLLASAVEKQWFPVFCLFISLCRSFCLHYTLKHVLTDSVHCSVLDCASCSPCQAAISVDEWNRGSDGYKEIEERHWVGEGISVKILQ